MAQQPETVVKPESSILVSLTLPELSKLASLAYVCAYNSTGTDRANYQALHVKLAAIETQHMALTLTPIDSGAFKGQL